MIVCLVTDRRRADPVGQAAAAARAGIDLVQVRERDLEARPLAALVARVLAAVRGSRTRVVVNDRLDVALACGAHGVHLRADSMPAGAVRLMAPSGFLVGRSVHSVAEAIGARRGVDYLFAGTVFPTSSKPAATRWIGIEGLRAIVQAADVPVLAIGGITGRRLDELAATGARGVAGIGLFCTPEGFASITDPMRFRFDSLKPAS